MGTVKIGGKLVGDGQPCFIVGEIGINHNGDLGLAKKLIDVATVAGCGAVKFQKRTVDVVYAPAELATPRESPFGTTNGDLKRALEFGQEEYEEIDKYCKNKIHGSHLAGTRRPWILWTALIRRATRSPRPH